MGTSVAGRAVAVSVLLGLSGMAHAQNGVYTFAFDTTQSGLAGEIETSASTTGTLIGNYNQETNPTGTRTKPGINIFEPFGPTENLPVNVSLGLGLGGALSTQTAGAFEMTFNAGAGAVTMSALSLDFISDGPLNLPVTIDLGTQGFRTRNPTFLYPPGQISLPIGQASVTSFSAVQTGPAAGVMTPGENPGEFNFLVTALVELSLTASVLDNEFSLPGGTPVLLPLGGTVTFNGDEAVILSVQPLAFEQAFEPGVALPEFPLALPTFNPDAPANVLMNLTLSQIGAGLDATLTTRATGTLVPSPGAFALCGLALLSAPRRRRTN